MLVSSANIAVAFYQLLGVNKRINDYSRIDYSDYGRSAHICTIRHLMRYNVQSVKVYVSH